MAQAFCADAAAWLAAHPENVVVVHCKAGKGRTGLMLCCLMLHLHLRAPGLAVFPPEALRAPGEGPAAGSGSGADGAAAGIGRDSSGPRGGGGVPLWWRRELQRQLDIDLSSMADPPSDVLALYAERRTHDGCGVTIPSQRRCGAGGGGGERVGGGQGGLPGGHWQPPCRSRR
jgi:hypothetical protein